MSQVRFLVSTQPLVLGAPAYPAGNSREAMALARSFLLDRMNREVRITDLSTHKSQTFTRKSAPNESTEDV